MAQTKEKRSAFASVFKSAQGPVHTAAAQPAAKRRLLVWIASGLAICFTACTGLLVALRPVTNATPDDGAAQGTLEIVDPNAAEVERALAPLNGASAGVEPLTAGSQVTITVNGAPVVSLPCEQDAQSLLTAALAAQTVDNGKAEFVDKVQVVPCTDGASVLGYEEAQMVLNTQSSLKIRCTVTKTEEKALPFETVNQNDSSLYVGSTKTKTQGQEGLQRKTTTITYLNGQETGRKEGAFETVKQPVSKVVLVGTKKKASTNTGGGSKVPGAPSFSWPVSGSITSPFGTRDGRLHAGIDIGKPIGSTVKASLAGTVTRAGSAGDYGILVEINHGNGWVTRYAHNSKVLVKAGDKVSKGQAIALSGNTGRSTGPHVHFEIRYNGVAKNPLTYLP